MNDSLNKKEVEAVIKLGPDRRYHYFINKVADRNILWGLYNSGWALSVTDDHIKCLPLWPAKEYAELCAIGEWSDFAPKALNLDNFLNNDLASMEENDIYPAIFYTPENIGVIVEYERLRFDLELELRRIQ